MAGHAQLKFVMTGCSKTQIRLTGLIYLHNVLIVTVQGTYGVDLLLLHVISK